jgi:hypothetical protein
VAEFAQFASEYQSKLDGLREQYKDMPPVRLYHGSMSERTPAKLRRGFYDPQQVSDKWHAELDVGATSFTKDLRLNYNSPEFGGPVAKNISYTEIPYADYLFRKVDMPLEAYRKKDMNVIARTITGSPDVARPMGVPRSLGFRETEDAFTESEKLQMKANPAETQKQYDLLAKQEDTNGKLFTKLLDIKDKIPKIAGTEQEARLANEAYKGVKLMIQNEMRYTGGKKALESGMLPTFESNQQFITGLNLRARNSILELPTLLDDIAKMLENAGANDKALVMQELKKNLIVLKETPKWVEGRVPT